MNFRTGSGAALDAEIVSAIRRGQPVLFYYWSPTPLLGRYKLIKLEEPPFDAEAWKTLADASHPNPRGTRSLPARLAIGVSAPSASATRTWWRCSPRWTCHRRPEPGTGNHERETPATPRRCA